MSDDRTNLGSGTCEIGTEHDDPRSGIRKLFAAALEAIFKEFNVASTTVATFLIFDFILHD